MASQTIYPGGYAEIDVPATQSIAITNYGGGIAKIYYLIKNTNFPNSYQFQQTLENDAVTLGPFSVDTNVRIEANNSKVFYDYGSSPDTGIGDADTLNGQAGSYYRNATNINAGTLADARLPATISSDITGTAANASALDSQNSAYYRNATNINAGTLATARLPVTVLRSDVSDVFNSDITLGIGTSSANGSVQILHSSGQNRFGIRPYYSGSYNDSYSISFDSDDGYWKKGSTGDDWFETRYKLQGSPAAKTTSATLTANELANGIITVNNGGGATTTLTLPTGSDMDTGFASVGTNYSFEFSVINISTVAAEDADIGTNTGWTLVGNMDIESNDSANARSAARFKARKAAAATWALYRLA